jgi:hypothetical protein
MKSYSFQIKKKVEEMKAGVVVIPDSFPLSWPRNAVTRALSRLNKEGLITRIKKGVYTKTKETRFGNVSATAIEIIANEIKNNDNKCFGGLFLYNNLGLTTQVPKIIEILNNKSSYIQELKTVQIRYVKIRPRIEKRTKQYILLLEVFKNLNRIPDSDVEHILKWINKKLDSIDKKGMNKLYKISLDYPPRVRAMLGCLLSIKEKAISEKIKKTLNVNSSYKVGSIVNYLQHIEQWRLKNEVA